MKIPRRRWFYVGSDMQHLALVDLADGIMEAYIEPRTTEEDSEEETESWKTPETITKHAFVAVLPSEMQVFPYDSSDEQTTHNAMIAAVAWVETVVGPPMTKVTWPGIILRSLLFWKYKQIWIDGRFVGLAVKSE